MPWAGRWLKALPVIPVLLGGAVWVNGYVAKTADVERLRVAVKDLSHELRLGQLENHRAILRIEAFRLQNADQREASVRQRRYEVENELHDVEQSLERLHRERREQP